MKTNKELNKPFYQAEKNFAKLFSLILMISLITFFSCQEDPSIELEEKTMTIVESEISLEIQELLDKTPTELNFSGDIISEPITGVCAAGVRSFDFTGTPSVADVPFYDFTTLNEAGRRNGTCGTPGLNQPCLYRGSFTINNVSGTTGNYIIITPFGTQVNANNVSNSYTYFYGTPQLPLGVYCGFINRYFVYAENPIVPNDWKLVFVVGFTCSNCDFGPVVPLD